MARDPGACFRGCSVRSSRGRTTNSSNDSSPRAASAPRWTAEAGRPPDEGSGTARGCVNETQDSRNRLRRHVYLQQSRLVRGAVPADRSTSSSRIATSSATSRRAARRSRPHSWGFTEIEFERDFLSIGKFGLRRAAGVFPDGTPFRMPDDDPLPAPIDVGANVRDQIVYLAVPLRRSGEPEVDRAGERRRPGAARRPGVAGARRHVRRRETRRCSRSARCARACCSRASVTQAYACIPLAHVVECRADKQVVLDDRFIPTGPARARRGPPGDVHDRAARPAAPARRGAGRTRRRRPAAGRPRSSPTS